MPRRARVSRTTWANSARSRKLLSPRGSAGEAGEGVSAAAMVLVDAGPGEWVGDSKGAKAAVRAGCAGGSGVRSSSKDAAGATLAESKFSSTLISDLWVPV